MKGSAKFLNIVLLISMLWTTVEDGVPDDKYAVLVLIIFITPIINLIYISSQGGGDFLSLYLERKRLEEKNKIESLRG